MDFEICRANMVPPIAGSTVERFGRLWTDWKRENDLMDFTDLLEKMPRGSAVGSERADRHIHRRGTRLVEVWNSPCSNKWGRGSRTVGAGRRPLAEPLRVAWFVISTRWATATQTSFSVSVVPDTRRRP